jgi:hypothetical protein
MTQTGHPFSSVAHMRSRNRARPGGIGCELSVGSLLSSLVFSPPPPLLPPVTSCRASSTPRACTKLPPLPTSSQATPSPHRPRARLKSPPPLLIQPTMDVLATSWAKLFGEVQWGKGWLYHQRGSSTTELMPRTIWGMSLDKIKNWISSPELLQSVI